MKTYFFDILLHKYATFNGRSGRKEFWFFNLWNALIIFVLYMIALVPVWIMANADEEPVGASLFLMIIGIVIFIYMLAMFIPLLSLTVRRLHDCGLSGWLVLLTFVIPIINLIYGILPPTPGPNQYDAE